MKASIKNVLEQNKILVIDGSMATALERLGADNSSALWTAGTLARRPDLVKQVHLDYFRAGADCGITCTYQATFPGLIKHGYSEGQAESIIADSIKIFLEAREQWWNEEGKEKGRVYPVCLAGIGPYGAYLADGSEYTGNYQVSDEELDTFHRKRLETVKEAGADVALIETQPSFHEAKIAAQICEEIGLDYWISFSCKDGKHINEGKEIQDCVKELSTGYPRLQMVGVNCTKPEYVASLIKEMKQGTDLPIGVYPNSGLIYDAKTKTWTQPEDILDFGSYATEYLEAGAVAVGGCCTTDVDQIQQVVQAKEQYLNKSL